MKAKKIPRIDIQDRMELKEAIPMTIPLIVYIDPCDTCNFRCKFCPSGNRELMKKTEGRNHGPMDFELYKTIIDFWNFQMTFLRKEKKLLSVCSCPSCGILKQGVPEDLDEFADELLDNM